MLKFMWAHMFVQVHSHICVCAHGVFLHCSPFYYLSQGLLEPRAHRFGPSRLSAVSGSALAAPSKHWSYGWASLPSQHLWRLPWLCGSDPWSLRSHGPSQPLTAVLQVREIRARELKAKAAQPAHRGSGTQIPTSLLSPKLSQPIFLGWRLSGWTQLRSVEF